MNFTIITYGAGEVLSTTFNAIATLINSRTGTLYHPLVRCGLIVGLVWATANMVHGNHTKFLTHWIMPLFLALVLFFAPTCRVHIYDPVTGYRFPVDHVPWGLGAVAGAISKIGDRMTKEVETVFSLPDDFKYHKTGAVMASNLIANARTFHITNSDLAETLQSFVTQCVVYDALLGKKYTLHDLKNSPNIWELVIDNLSPARSFTFKAPGKGQKSQIVPCIKAVPLLNQWLKQDMQTAFQLFESIVFGKKDKKTAPHLASLAAGSQLKQYLPGAFQYMTQMAKSAEDVMMQQMMIYSVVDSIENTSTSLGNAPNFAIRRAYLHQRANQETLAGVAAQKLIAMKNVLEALIYAGFIFILPLALLPMGWSFISRWIGLVFWIQLWPPLYAILNFIMNVSAMSKGIGMISGPQGSGITIANSVGFMNLHADMAAQAGFMSLAVGSIAYALVKGGAASFVHLASHLGGPAAAAASRATEDLMSGNYSFGNVNQGNIQAYNTSFGQQNLSPSYSSGAFTQNDGVISRTTGSDGSHMVTVSNSNLRSSLNFSESLSNSYTEQASKAKQTAETQLVAASQAEADHNRQVMDFSEHKAKQVSGSESYSTGDTATTNQAFTKLDGLVDRFAKDHSVSKEVAAQIMARASASTSVGIGFKLFGKTGASAELRGELSGGVSGSANDRDLFSAAKDYSQQSNFQEALNQASQAARDGRYAELSDKGQRAASSINDSYEKSHQYRDEASASLQQSESFSQMASWTKQNAGNINANLNQEYVNWLQDQSLPNSSGPMGIREAETIFTSRPELDSHYQQRFMEDKMQQADQFIGSHGLASQSSDIDKSYDQAKRRIANPVNQEINQSAAASQASAHGLGNDFEVSTGPRDEAKKTLSSTGKQMAEQQQLLAQQAEMRKAEVGLKETKPVKTGTAEAGTVKSGSAKAETEQPPTMNREAIQSQMTQSEIFQRLVSRMGGDQNILAHAKALQNGKAEAETTEIGTAEVGTIKNNLPQEVSQQRTIQIETPQDGGAQTAVVQGEAVRTYNDRATEPAIAQASTLQTGLSQREDAQSMGTSGSSQRETLQNTEIQTEPIETGAIASGAVKVGTTEKQFAQTQIGHTESAESGGFQSVVSQASEHDLGNGFEVNTEPRDDAQKILSSTGHRMVEQQQPLAQQAEMGNAEAGLDEARFTKTRTAETGAIETEVAEMGTIKTGTDQSRTINREVIHSQGAQSEPFQSLSSQTEGGQNILTQAKTLQAGTAQTETDQTNIAQIEAFQTAVNQPETFQNRQTQTISAAHSTELLQNEGFQNAESHHGTTQADTSQSRKDERIADQFGTAETGIVESRLSAHRETSQPRAPQIETRQGEGTQATTAVAQGEAAQAFHHRTTESATAQTGALQTGLSQREGSQVMGGQTGSSQTETSPKRESQEEPIEAGIVKTGAVKAETVENQVSQTQIGQTGSAESKNASSQALAQSTRGDLKVSLPSQRDLKEKLTSIEDKLMEQQEFLERETLQRKEKAPSK